MPDMSGSGTPSKASLGASTGFLGGSGVPPVRFESLVELVAPAAIRPGIGRLLADKRIASELGTGRPIPELQRFVEAELERHRGEFSGLGRTDLLDSGELRSKLNTIFRDALDDGPADHRTTQ